MHFDQSTPSGTSTPVFEEALAIFMLDMKARRLSTHTLDFYESRMNQAFAWFKKREITHVGQLTANHIRTYLGSLDERGLASHSQHAAARAIKTFCNFCVNEEWIDTSPMKRVRMPRVEEEIHPALEPEEVQKLLDASQNERDKAIILCLLDTGCRANEFLSWTGGDLDVEHGTVKVLGKNRKERLVYLGARSLKQLLRYFIERGRPDPAEPLWVTVRDTSEPMTYNALRLMFRRLSEETGIKDVTPHRFRRTFALWSLRNGMSIYELRKLMGHADLTVLQRYLALVESDLAQAHQRHGAVDNMLRKSQPH